MGAYQNRLVVKVGTSTLTNDLGQSDLRSFDRLACVLSDVRNAALATTQGIDTTIANGERPQTLYDIINIKGKRIGTLFAGKG